MFAAERKIETAVYDAMRNLAGVYESQDGDSFRSAITNPYVSEDTKRSLILSAAGVAGKKSAVADALNDFVSLLFRNNRISELRGIVYAFDTLYRKEKKISRVHVVWAAPPSAESEKRLKALIERHLDNGTMEYSSSVNPDLIGGFKISIDNEQLDASVENELRQLRQQILSK